jgi:flavocytochrome c
LSHARVAGRIAASVALVTLALAAGCKRRSAAPTTADAIVVGAGIAGLSAAYELGKGGANVIIVDTASVFGGHAVMATGDLCLVDTPFQRAQGIADSPDLAYKDLVTWGEDPNPEWARAYADHSRDQVHDWLVSLGAGFELLIQPPGNSVPRTHRTKGRGIGLVSPIFKESARRPNVAFRWNTRVDRLLVENGRVTGVAATNVRTKEKVTLRARVVVMATGGFQSNLEKVRAAWPAGQPFPERFLVGSGINSMGTGLDVAQAAGAALTRLDHQWNYITGLPDPRFPGTPRGLNAYNVDSIWVNADAKRFLIERSSPKDGLPVLARQKGGTYWSIFDEDTKRTFWVAGSDWAKFETIEREIFANAALMKSASTIEEVATKAGLPPAALRATVDRFNAMVDKGVDDDVGRFGPGKDYKPHKVLRPPFYAAQFFPMTRKSEGGVAIDASARVVDTKGSVIPGLYAAGELTGVGGVNGKHALEGTFLGPSMLTGRVAGRTALAEIGAKPAPATVAEVTPPAIKGQVAPNCMNCHQVPTLVANKREGYWHFERVHAVVLARQYDCSRCHAELGAYYDPSTHRIDRLAQPRVCTTCHSGEDPGAAKTR